MRKLPRLKIVDNIFRLRDNLQLKTFKLITVLSLIVIVPLFMVACGEDEKEFVPTQSFAIVLSVEASQRLEPFTVEDFPEWKLHSVEDHGNIIRGVQRHLVLYLWEEDRQTLYYVIDLMRQRPDVVDWGGPPD